MCFLKKHFGFSQYPHWFGIGDKPQIQFWFFIQLIVFCVHFVRQLSVFISIPGAVAWVNNSSTYHDGLISSSNSYLFHKLLVTLGWTSCPFLYRLGPYKMISMFPLGILGRFQCKLFPTLNKTSSSYRRPLYPVSAYPSLKTQFKKLQYLMNLLVDWKKHWQILKSKESYNILWITIDIVVGRCVKNFQMGL